MSCAECGLIHKHFLFFKHNTLNNNIPYLVVIYLPSWYTIGVHKNITYYTV